MKKLLLVFLTIITFYSSAANAQENQDNFSIGATLSFSGGQPGFLVHAESTILPIDGFGIRGSTEIGIGNGNPIYLGIDLLYFTPINVYFGGGVTIITYNAFGKLQVGFNGVIGYEILLYNAIGIFFEARPIYVINPVGPNEIIVPVTIGIRLRFS